MQNPGLEVSRSFFGDPFGDNLRLFWVDWGSGPSLHGLGHNLGPQGGSQSQFGEDVLSGMTADSADPAEMVSRAAVQTLPSMGRKLRMK